MGLHLEPSFEILHWYISLWTKINSIYKKKLSKLMELYKSSIP